MSPEKIAVIGAIATVIAGFGGAILGAWPTRRSTIAILKRQDFNKAATEFRDAFLCEIIYLRYNARLTECERTYTSVHEFLRAGYVFRHLKAFEIFRNYLSVTGRKAIDKVWDEYCHPQGIPEDQDEKRDFRFNDYMAIEEHDGIDKAKEIALQRIEKLRDFARHK